MRSPTSRFRLVVLAFSLTVAAGCAAESSEDSTTSPVEPAAQAANADDADPSEEVGTTADELVALTFANVGPKITTTCGGCHAQFKTLAGIKAEKTAMIAKINAGLMPKGNPTWKKTADGKKVLKWLKTGADLK